EQGMAGGPELPRGMQQRTVAADADDEVCPFCELVGRQRVGFDRCADPRIDAHTDAARVEQHDKLREYGSDGCVTGLTGQRDSFVAVGHAAKVSMSRASVYDCGDGHGPP